MIKNIYLAAMLGCMTALAACTNDVTESDTAIGLYRLVSVRGLSVPYGENGYLVRSGDIVLRMDNSAFGVMRTSFYLPIINFDRYRLIGDRVEFTYRDSVVNTGTIAGDSLLMDVRLYANGAFGDISTVVPAVFRRSAGDPVDIRDGTYVLTIVKNRPIAQQPLPGFVIDYDTIQFSDGVFYRRKRKEQLRDAAGNAGPAGSSSSLPGTYRGNSKYVLLGAVQDTSRFVAAPTRDSLIVQNGALIRLSWRTDGSALEDRYEKRP